MCDTMVALPSITKDGAVYFATNSDRDPNEAQQVIIFPGGEHKQGSTLRCTYIGIPQVQ